MLMAVGRHPILLSKTNHVRFRPLGDPLRAERLKETVLLAALRSGAVHPNMQRKDVPRSPARRRERGPRCRRSRWRSTYDHASKAEQAALLTKLVQSLTITNLLQEMTPTSAPSSRIALRPPLRISHRDRAPGREDPARRSQDHKAAWPSSSSALPNEGGVCGARSRLELDRDGSPDRHDERVGPHRQQRRTLIRGNTTEDIFDHA